jgi:hypothetical protein
VKISRIDSGTSFAGGFIISSEASGGMSDPGVCGRAPIPKDPAVWFSADGKTWTPQPLPGQHRGAGDSITVCRINGLLLAEEWMLDGRLQWSSTDGRAWTTTSADVGCSGDGPGGMMSFGGLMPLAGHYLYTDPPDDMYGNAWQVRVVSADLHLETMLQTGDVPWWDWYGEGLGAEVLGPAGLILSDGNGNLWVGVPTDG